MKMTAMRQASHDETLIRERIERWAKALRAKDLAGVMSHYAADVLYFDLAPPLQYRGDDVRQGLAQWFPTWDGPIGYEFRDLTIAASGDVAFSHSLDRLTGKRTNGEQTDIWIRSTVCFRKIDGDWKVVHVHSSVPFYMDGSFRASVDLTP